MDTLLMNAINSSHIEIEYATYKHIKKIYKTKSTVIPVHYSVAKALKVCAISNLSDSKY